MKKSKIPARQALSPTQAVNAIMIYVMRILPQCEPRLRHAMVDALTEELADLKPIIVTTGKPSFPEAEAYEARMARVFKHLKTLKVKAERAGNTVELEGIQELEQSFRSAR